MHIAESLISMPLPKSSLLASLPPRLTSCSRLKVCPITSPIMYSSDGCASKLIKPGLDMYDREEAKRHARQQAEQALNQSGQY